MLRMPRFACSTALLALFCACVCSAQVTTGTILGSVRDTTGAGVAGAQITITEVNKGTSQQANSDDNGDYNVPFLIPGVYRVQVEKQGFKRALSADTNLSVDQKARVDFTMEVGQLSETVTVEASAPLVRSETAELGEVVNQRAVQELPLNGRNFAQLVYLVPGVTPGQAGENLSGASTFNPRAGSNFNALGSQANANAWLVDGIVDNEYTFNTVMVQPSVESVYEFKVLTGTYSAEFGRGAGVVTTQTRSGSNQFHGSLFEFLRNSYLDARNYFNAKPQAQPPYRRNQFGGSIGGPIIRNKTFFFADYYGWREIKGQTFINTVPTAQQRTGDFGDLAPATVIYDPASLANGATSRTPFPNNRIPANRIDPVGANVASIYPLPNIPGRLFNNRTDTLNRDLKDNGGNVRIDHRFNEKDALFGRYSFEQFILFDTRGQGGCCIPTPASAASRFDLGPFIAGGQNTELAASGFAFNETHVFSPTVVNEFIAGFARTNPLTRQSDYGHNAASSLGIQGININQFTSGLPTINITSIPGQPAYTSLNGGPAFLPANPRQTSYQLQDSVSWSRASHNLKFGYRVVKDSVSPFTNTNTRSTLNFGLNLVNQTNGTGGNGLASLLLGLLANGTSPAGTRGFLQTPYYLTIWEHSAFVQDDWKVNPRLTLNLGLRWDVFTPYTEQRNRLTNFDIANLRLVYAGVNGISDTAGVQTRWNNLGPHVGFAYDIGGNGKTVLRGGFSMSYFPEQPSASNFLGQAVPWAISQNTVSPSTQYPANLSTVPVISNPFGPPVPVQPVTTADLIATNPSVLGASFRNQTPYYETWTFNIERQLGANLMTELAYAGSRGVHLIYCYNPQEVLPGTGSANSRVTIPAIATLRSITQCDPRNSSNYHGFQSKLVKRFSHGLQFLASYTWSRSLDYGGSAASGGGAVGNPQTVTNLKAGYGPSGFDVPQRFVGSWTWELPFGPGKTWMNSGLLSNIVGGWQLGGIVTLQSGLPFTIGNMTTCVNNATACWPDRVASGSLARQDYSRWFDPSAFVAPCAVAPVNGICPGQQWAYRFGTSGRGILRAPATYNFDLSAAKNFAIKERWRVQFRVDAFNAFNRPVLGFPNTGINPANPAASSTAITTTLGDNRDLQAALRVMF